MNRKNDNQKAYNPYVLFTFLLTYTHAHMHTNTDTNPHCFSCTQVHLQRKKKTVGPLFFFFLI